MDIIPLVFLAFIFFFIVQTHTLRSFKGIWRKLSLVSALLMTLVLIYTFYALIQNSNSWPVILLAASPVAFIYQVILLIIYQVVQSRGNVTKSKQENDNV